MPLQLTVNTDQRIREALAAKARARAAQVIEGPDGAFAALDPEWDRSHHNNKVIMPNATRPAALLDFVEEAMTGLAHRQLEVLDPHAEALLAAAVKVGYTPTTTLLMTLPPESPLARPDPRIDVRQVDEDAMRIVATSVWQSEMDDEETVRQLVGRRETYPRAGDIRPYVVTADGQGVAHADLQIADGIAEIDSVVTLPAFRKRGFGRALVLTAARDARGLGAEVIFLQADYDDWPKEMYARLGFNATGQAFELHRSPT